MTVSVKAPTSTTGSIQLNGSDVLTIESDRSVDIDSGTLHVDATNNRVGIGTSSPANNLDVNGGARFATSQWVQFGTNNTFYADASYGLIVKAPATSNFIAFRDSSDTERMRIDSSGFVRINNTSNATYAAQLNIYSPSTINCAIHCRTNTSGTQSQIIFGNSTNDAVGSIHTSGSSTAYNTSSDYRLKENVAPMSGSIDRLKQLKPSTWTWIHGGNGEGFLAHEAQTVVPEAISGTKDAMRTEEYEVTPAVTDDEGNITTAAVMGTREVPVYQGIDQSKLVPLLTSALQEAITKIEDLESRIQALESA